MTTLAAAKQTILSTIKTWADAVVPALPVEFQGESFDTESLGGRWAAVIIQTPGDEQISLGKTGTRNHKLSGTMTMQVRVPGGDTGTTPLDTLLEAARALFRDKSLDGIYFGGVPLGPVAARNQSLTGSIIAPFHFYQLI